MTLTTRRRRRRRTMSKRKTKMRMTTRRRRRREMTEVGWLFLFSSISNSTGYLMLKSKYLVCHGFIFK